MRGTLGNPDNFLAERVQEVANHTYAGTELIDPNKRVYAALSRYGFVAAQALFEQSGSLYSEVQTSSSAGTQVAINVRGPLSVPPDTELKDGDRLLDDILIRQLVNKKVKPIASRVFGGFAFKGVAPSSTCFEILAANFEDFRGKHGSRWLEVATFSSNPRPLFSGDKLSFSRMVDSAVWLGRIANANHGYDIPEPEEVVDKYFKELSDPSDK